MKKVLILILLFYFLALLQTSFLSHFNIFSFIPNFILISFLVINLLENPKKDKGLWAGIIGGFFWDIFSSNFLGFHILILLISALAIKFILRNYFFFILHSRKQF